MAGGCPAGERYPKCEGCANAAYAWLVTTIDGVHGGTARVLKEVSSLCADLWSLLLHQPCCFRSNSLFAPPWSLGEMPTSILRSDPVRAPGNVSHWL